MTTPLVLDSSFNSEVLECWAHQAMLQRAAHEALIAYLRYGQAMAEKVTR
ncbi:hypothetical protein [Billgrantia endophytica]|nr:hypothetical protein [Halomonas endophytica]